MKKITSQILKPGIVSIAFFGFALLASATGTYVAPTGTPPANNVDAPINVGTTAQLKNGTLTLSGAFGAALHADIGSDPCEYTTPCMHPLGYTIPTTEVLHVYGLANVLGSLKVNGHDVCTEDGTNCPAAAAPLVQWNTVGTTMSNANTGNVGIGTNAPQQQLSVSGGLNIDQASANPGGSLTNGLTFGSGSGEGIASRRTASGAGIGAYDLAFYTAYGERMSIANNGDIFAPGVVIKGDGTRETISHLRAGGANGDGIAIYVDRCSGSGGITLNAATCGGSGALVGYLIHP